jgi:hypothetical protein
MQPQSLQAHSEVAVAAAQAARDAATATSLCSAIDNRKVNISFRKMIQAERDAATATSLRSAIDNRKSSAAPIVALGATDDFTPTAAIGMSDETGGVALNDTLSAFDTVAQAAPFLLQRVASELPPGKLPPKALFKALFDALSSPKALCVTTTV